MHPVTIVLLGALAWPTPPQARPAQLQITYDSGILEGTCSLVDVDSQGDEVQLLFLTSQRLFKSSDGNTFMPAREVRVTLDDGRAVIVPREGVILPSGNMIDVALLRVPAPDGGFTPAPLTWTPPATGGAFEIDVYDSGRQAASFAAQVRFSSTRSVVGDQDISGVAGCVGSPARGPEGIFGIVSECEPHRAPVITLLSGASSFLARHLPRLRFRPTDTISRDQRDRGRELRVERR